MTLQYFNAMMNDDERYILSSSDSDLGERIIIMDRVHEYVRLRLVSIFADLVTQGQIKAIPESLGKSKVILAGAIEDRKRTWESCGIKFEPEKEQFQVWRKEYDASAQCEGRKPPSCIYITEAETAEDATPAPAAASASRKSPRRS